MITANLSKSNFIPDEQALLIESVIGCEITNVITFNPLSEILKNHITPYTNNYRDNAKRYAWKVKDVIFNKATGLLTFKGRDKWQRIWSDYKIQFTIIGYKLPTTHINGGYCFGA